MKTLQMTIRIAFFAFIFSLLFVSQLPGAKGYTPDESWLTFMGNSHRTGSVTGATGPDVGEQIWTFRDGILGSPFAASPAISGNRVYIGARHMGRGRAPGWRRSGSAMPAWRKRQRY